MKKEEKGKLSIHQKDHLKRRIMFSVEGEINREKKKRQYLWSGSVAAAILTFFFCLNLYQEYTKEPTIEDFVKMTPEIDIEKVKGVTLILDNETNINLTEEISEIRYSETGEQIVIGSGKEVNQKLLSEGSPKFNTVVVPYGKRTSVELSDGTVVWLNSGSKMVYPAVFTGKSRSVVLEGEAIFDVTHKAEIPFKVISGTQEIEVLGTVFNVRNYPGDESIETVLKSGSIRLRNRNMGSKTIKLTPGSKATLNARTAQIEIKKVDVDKYFSWKKGFLACDGTSLEEIMKRLSQYYGVTILIEDKNLAAETFSGYLDLKEDLNEIIELVGQTAVFQVKRNENKILILKQ